MMHGGPSQERQVLGPLWNRHAGALTMSFPFVPPHIPHAIAVMVVAIAFHTKDPDGVGDALNIFLFTDLSPLAGLEAALLMRNWDAILGGGTLNSFADTSLLMGKQKFAPITGWDKAASQLEAWDVFCMVFLSDKAKHPANFEMFLLNEKTSRISLRLRAQAHQKPSFPAALLRLIQQELNESLYQALKRQQRVRWTDFKILQRSPVTGNFRPDIVALPSGARSTRTSRPTASSAWTSGDDSAYPHSRRSTTTPRAADLQPTAGDGENPVPLPIVTVWSRLPDLQCG